MSVMRICALPILTIVASLSGFFVHVMTIGWLLPYWIGNQMQRIGLKPPWTVRYVAV